MDPGEVGSRKLTPLEKLEPLWMVAVLEPHGWISDRWRLMAGRKYMDVDYEKGEGS